MKKYFVIGNPIEHSLSPQLHNYWLKKNNIDATYEKKKLETNEIKNLILDIKEKKINGINVTVPFKREVVPYLENLSMEAEATQSVNTILLENNKIKGYNTDIDGFELSIKDIKFDVKDKNIFILGAGGVVPSIIFALNKMNVSSISISNRSKENAENLKNLFKNINIVEWGDIPNFDMIINATSLGLKEEDKINLDFSKIGTDKFFYDVIYNPKNTNFLKKAKELGNEIENGKMMFIYQAHQAFAIWHKILPEIDIETIKLLDD